MLIGLVGTGHWAKATHAPAIAAHPNHELIGVWGRSGARRHSLAENFDTAAFDSFDDMLDAVDGVAFATDPEQQTSLSARVGSAGKHLILDKPAALTAHQAKALLEASQTFGSTVKVFHTARYRPEIERWIHGAVAGTWRGGTGRWLGAALSDSDSPYFGSDWRKVWGPLWDAGPHAMSILLPIFGCLEGVTETRWVGPTLKTTLVFSSADVNIELSVAEPSKISSIELTLNGPSGSTVMPDISTTAQVAYGRLLDHFTADGDVGDLRLGVDVVAALEQIAAAVPSAGDAFDTTGRR